MAHLPPFAVVFDINVYLDIARLMGQPYSEAALRMRLASHRPNPQFPNPQIEAGQAVLFCSTGNFAGPQRIQIWSSTWIERSVERIAKRSPTQNGLGWSDQNAKALRNDLVMGTAVTPSSGQSVQSVRGVSYPGLNDDDSQVLHTAKQALDYNSISFCVTSDVGFRTTTSCGSVIMLTPRELVDRMREARRKIATIT